MRLTTLCCLIIRLASAVVETLSSGRSKMRQGKPLSACSREDSSTAGRWNETLIRMFIYAILIGTVPAKIRGRWRPMPYFHQKEKELGPLASSDLPGTNDGEFSLW